MADHDGARSGDEPAAPDDGPSLELPSLGLRRRRRRRASAISEEPPTPSAAPVAPAPPPAREQPAVPVPGAAEPVEEPRTRRPLSSRTSPMVFAVITGLVVGACAVGLTWLGLRGCEELQGTPSCGNPGFLILLAIFVLMVVAGTWLLRAAGVEDPGSTSFLGVGLLAVIALLFLIDVIFSGWMLLAIPLVGMATFALAHWVTTALVDADR